MNLKNYSSTVPASQTIATIEAFLAECGVSSVFKQFEDKIPVAIFFQVELPAINGAPRRFTVRLPAKVNDVQEYLWRDYCRNHRRLIKSKQDLAEQAARTAWKIQRDWVEVQMSLIKLKQADFLEVFMGFIWNGEQTFYQQIQAGQFKQLPQSTQS